MQNRTFVKHNFSAKKTTTKNRLPVSQKKRLDEKITELQTKTETLKYLSLLFLKVIVTVKSSGCLHLVLSL